MTVRSGQPKTRKSDRDEATGTGSASGVGLGQSEGGKPLSKEAAQDRDERTAFVSNLLYSTNEEKLFDHLHQVSARVIRQASGCHISVASFRAVLEALASGISLQLPIHFSLAEGLLGHLPHVRVPSCKCRTFRLFNQHISHNIDRV